MGQSKLSIPEPLTAVDLKEPPNDKPVLQNASVPTPNLRIAAKGSTLSILTYQVNFILIQVSFQT